MSYSYFNSTKVSSARKKVRAPFTSGYAHTQRDVSKKEQKRVENERAWNKTIHQWEKETLIEKLQYGDNYNRYYCW